MAIAGHLMRFSFGGAFFGTETWQCNLHFQSGVAAQPDPVVIKNALVKFQPMLNAGGRIGWWKYNEIDQATGKYLGTDSFTYEVNPILNGQSQVQPPQLTTVLTLGTAKKRGYAHTGRIYLPFNPPIGGDGLIAPADVLGFQTIAKDFLLEVSSAATHRLIVWSDTAKVANDVTTVAIGRVVDTQRRRRRNLNEAKTPVALF